MSEPAGVWLPGPLVGELVDRAAVDVPAVPDDVFRDALDVVLADQAEHLAALAGLERAHGW